MEVEREDESGSESAEDNSNKQTGDEEAEAKAETVDVRQAGRWFALGFGTNGVNQKMVGFGHGLVLMNVSWWFTRWRVGRRGGSGAGLGSRRGLREIGQFGRFGGGGGRLI